MKCKWPRRRKVNHVQFGEFLVSRRRVSQADLDMALEKQRAIQTPLGRLALQGGYLTAQQVAQILAKQAQRCDLSNQVIQDVLFGDIAIRKAFLKREDLFELLRQQRETRATIGEVLLEMGCMTRKELWEDLMAFGQIAAGK